jgi:hypothetical protein
LVGKDKPTNKATKPNLNPIILTAIFFGNMVLRAGVETAGPEADA